MRIVINFFLKKNEAKMSGELETFDTVPMDAEMDMNMDEMDKMDEKMEQGSSMVDM